VSSVVVPSRFLRDRVVALGFAEETIETIPAGVDTRFFRPSPLDVRSRDVLFVGRLVEKKGIDVLMAAWALVAAEISDARLTVLGDGPLAHLVPRDDPSIRHLQPATTAPHAQVRSAMQRARVVVTPSRTSVDGDAESLLLVNLEAQASGRPVVTTAHGGICEFVQEGTTALVVAENDPDALAAALCRVVSDDHLATALGAAGPAWAERFDARESVARVDALYDRLLARRTRGRR
jgi:glycosyltransferase involved in cell wall biosynthesis